MSYSERRTYATRRERESPCVYSPVSHTYARAHYLPLAFAFSLVSARPWVLRRISRADSVSAESEDQVSVSHPIYVCIYVCMYICMYEVIDGFRHGASESVQNLGPRRGHEGSPQLFQVKPQCPTPFPNPSIAPIGISCTICAPNRERARATVRLHPSIPPRVPK